MAVANSLAGVKAGARQVEAAMNGLGERAGNAALEEIAMALKVRRDIYGVKTGINTEAIASTSRMVARYTGYPVPKNKAVVGANAFQHESGIHQGGVLRDRSTFEIMRAADVGIETDGMSLGRQSGRSVLKYVLEAEGTFDGSVMSGTYTMFNELTDKVGAVSREQLVEIHEEAKRRHDNPYSLDKYEVSASGNDNESTYSAEVVVNDGTGHDRKPVSASNDDLEHPSVDGATSALFTAIKDAIIGMQGIHQGHPCIEFSSFELDSVGEGEQTIGKATVSMKVNGKPVTGCGVAFDTMQASGWAYLDALRQGL
jgi:2-isopropylmalate synthase